MEFSGVLAMVFIGAIAGWLSGKIMEGRGFGLIGKYHRRNRWCVSGGYDISGLGFRRWRWALVLDLLCDNWSGDPIVPDRFDP